MDDPTISDREYHERRRTPTRVRLPLWASVAITVVVLVVAAVKLQPKTAAPDA
jgi:type VI protein secretion system component VasF